MPRILAVCPTVRKPASEFLFLEGEELPLLARLMRLDGFPFRICRRTRRERRKQFHAESLITYDKQGLIDNLACDW